MPNTENPSFKTGINKSDSQNITYTSQIYSKNLMIVSLLSSEKNDNVLYDHVKQKT